MARVKGQETTFTLVDSEGNEEDFGDKVSLSIDIDIEILEEHYLSGTAARYDMIYNGIGGTVEFHVNSTRPFRLAELIKLKSQRRLPGNGTFNSTTSLQFPSGELVRVSIEDMSFGPIPLTIASRKDYTGMSFQFKASNFRLLY